MHLRHELIPLNWRLGLSLNAAEGRLFMENGQLITVCASGFKWSVRHIGCTLGEQQHSLYLMNYYYSGTTIINWRLWWLQIPELRWLSPSPGEKRRFAGGISMQRHKMLQQIVYHVLYFVSIRSVATVNLSVLSPGTVSQVT